MVCIISKHLLDNLTFINSDLSAPTLKFRTLNQSAKGTEMTDSMKT